MKKSMTIEIGKTYIGAYKTEMKVKNITAQINTLLGKPITHVEIQYMTVEGQFGHCTETLEDFQEMINRKD